MRVISGNYRGKALISPENKKIRPTSDRGKKVIFDTLNSILIAQKRSFEQMVIIDLFCGTGALGIEAISRGGKKLILIDNCPNALKLASINCRKLNIKEVKFLELDFNEIENTIEPADIIFLDPPYNHYDSTEIIEKIYNSNLLKINGILVFETSKKDEFESFKKLKFIKKKKVSSSLFYFFTYT